MNIKTYKTSYIVGGIILFILFTPFTVVNATEGPGSTGASYLTLPVSPRSIAMGEVGSSVDNPFALFYNPALVSESKGNGIGISHSEWIIDTRYDNISIHSSINQKLTLGFGVNYLYRPDIQGYDASGDPTTDLKSNNYQVALGFGFSPVNWLSTGLNIKYFRENLGEWYASGMAMDLGLLYKMDMGFSAGFAVQNIGPDINFKEIKEPLPLTIRAGASQSIDIEKDKISLTVAADAVKEKYQEIYISAGAELELFKILALRTGYCGEKYRSGNGFSMGGGISVNDEILIGYSYSPYGELGDFHRISVHFSR
jgi:hypothetical protein